MRHVHHCRLGRTDTAGRIPNCFQPRIVMVRLPLSASNYLYLLRENDMVTTVCQSVLTTQQAIA